jgi:hypothetical protein
MKKLTLKQARKYAIIKWEYTANNEGSNIGLLETHPVLKGFIYNCSYCEKYLYTHNDHLISCAQCPIRPKIEDYDNLYDIGCMQHIHPYYKWSRHSKSSSEIKYSKKLLELIKSRKLESK